MRKIPTEMFSWDRILDEGFLSLIQEPPENNYENSFQREAGSG
jgi:hypothetical protein